MKTTHPENNPRTGIIDKGPQGITFRGLCEMRGYYAFAGIKQNTKWFLSYSEAKQAFNEAL